MSVESADGFDGEKVEQSDRLVLGSGDKIASGWVKGNLVDRTFMSGILLLKLQ